MKQISVWEVLFPCITSGLGLVLFINGKIVGCVAFQCVTYVSLLAVFLIHMWKSRPAPSQSKK